MLNINFIFIDKHSLNIDKDYNILKIDSRIKEKFKLSENIYYNNFLKLFFVIL